MHACKKRRNSTFSLLGGWRECLHAINTVIVQKGVRRHCGNLQSDMLGSGAVPVWLTEKAPKNDRKGGAGTRFRTFPTSVPTPDQVPILVFGFRGARSKNPDSLRPCGAVTPIALGRTVRPTVLTSSYRSIKKSQAKSDICHYFIFCSFPLPKLDCARLRHLHEARGGATQAINNGAACTVACVTTITKFLGSSTTVRSKLPPLADTMAR